MAELENTLKIISDTKDLRTDTTVIYAQISILDYLNLVGRKFDRFEIQRPRQNYKAYERMKDDIINGALLPSITLAVNPKVVGNYIKLWENKQEPELIKELYVSKNLFILDGLQRTYVISDLINSGTEFYVDQKLHLEIWLEKELKHLIYRLIILNAGQKPMSMRHQVELLFMTMQDKLKEEIPDLDLFKERDETRRNVPKKFPFDRIVTAYYCFITKSPEERRDNLVVQQLSEHEVFNSDEESLSKDFFDFTTYLESYVAMDTEVFRVYDSFREPEIKSPKNWLVEDNVINSFFAAVAQFNSDVRMARRVTSAIARLLSNLKLAKPNTDPLSLKVLSELRKGINPKKVNVGFETRRLLSSGFKEYFREEGNLSLSECWRLAAV